jgi:di/tricarboxylate transporter
MLFSAFMNNVATAIVMGQVGAQAAGVLGVPVEAALIAVLIGTSCDFLTPIGHQNNLVVMRPGGYRFSDYPRMGAPLTLLVILMTALMLDMVYF